ncbi:MAG: replicative DNA helicase [Rikenellaceae bacterium]
MAKEKSYAERKKIAEKKAMADELSAISRQVGQLPPQAMELEEAVLGAIMLEKNALLNIQGLLSPESFYHDAHQLIYAAALELSANIQPVDLYTIGDQLKRDGNLAAVGGMNYLTELTMRVSSATHLDYHAKIVAQKYIQRQLITASSRIQKDAFSDEQDVNELVNSAEKAIFEIAEGNVRRDVLSSQDIVARAMQVIEEASNRPDGMTGVPTGFTDIDRLTLGWQLSDLIIIAARPSMGKTAFVLTMARNIALDHKKTVAFFSLEMSSTQLMMRLLIAESQLESKKIKSGKLSPDEWKQLEGAARPLSKAQLYIDDTPALSVYEFRSKARRLKRNHNVELIVIDYLQLMTAGTADSRGNREQEVALISRSLKAIAKELDVPIIALSQLNRSVESRGGSKRPQLSDLRESGSIEQDADIVAFIHRPEYFGLTETEEGTPTAGLAEIIFAKHRNGEVRTEKLRFRHEQAKFVDWDDTGFGSIGTPAAGPVTTYSTIDSSSFSAIDSTGMDALSASQGRIEMAQGTNPSYGAALTPADTDDFVPY